MSAAAAHVRAHAMSSSRATADGSNAQTGPLATLSVEAKRARSGSSSDGSVVLVRPAKRARPAAAGAAAAAAGAEPVVLPAPPAAPLAPPAPTEDERNAYWRDHTRVFSQVALAGGAEAEALWAQLKRAGFAVVDVGEVGGILDELAAPGGHADSVADRAAALFYDTIAHLACYNPPEAVTGAADWRADPNKPPKRPAAPLWTPGYSGFGTLNTPDSLHNPMVRALRRLIHERIVRPLGRAAATAPPLSADEIAERRARAGAAFAAAYAAYTRAAAIVVAEPAVGAECVAAPALFDAVLTTPNYETQRTALAALIRTVEAEHKRQAGDAVMGGSLRALLVAATEVVDRLVEVRAADELAEADARDAALDHAQTVIDRMAYRAPGDTATAEAWHRDQPSSGPQTADARFLTHERGIYVQTSGGQVTFGGWVNFDRSRPTGGDRWQQTLVCIPASHARHTTAGQGGGFARVFPYALERLDAERVLIAVPPGHMLVFNESLIHSVVSVEHRGWRGDRRLPPEAMQRVFTGFCLSPSPEPLLHTEPNVRRALLAQDTFILKSGQEMRMYPLMPGAGKSERIARWAAVHLRPGVHAAIARARDDPAVQARWRGANKTRTLGNEALPAVMLSLAELAERSADQPEPIVAYPPYVDDEIEIYLMRPL